MFANCINRLSARPEVVESSRISTAFMVYDLRGAAAQLEVDEISRISTDFMVYDIRHHPKIMVGEVEKKVIHSRFVRVILAQGPC